MKTRAWFTLLLLMGAANLYAIEVTPTYQIFTIKPGNKTSGEFTLTNNEDERITISLTSKDWFVLPSNEKFKAPDWLTFSENEFSMEKGTSRKVQFFVECPKGAQGELVGMVSFGIAGEIPSNVNKILSVAIYSAAQGTEKLKANLKAFMIAPSSRSVDVSVLLTNEGNVHIRPSGWFTIKNNKGDIVANLMMQPGPPTYPGKDGVYSGSVKDFKMRPGMYKAYITMMDTDRHKEILNTFKKFELLENNVVELR